MILTVDTESEGRAPLGQVQHRSWCRSRAETGDTDQSNVEDSGIERVEEPGGGELSTRPRRHSKEGEATGHTWSCVSCADSSLDEEEGRLCAMVCVRRLRLHVGHCLGYQAQTPRTSNWPRRHGRDEGEDGTVGPDDKDMSAEAARRSLGPEESGQRLKLIGCVLHCSQEQRSREVED